MAKSIHKEVKEQVLEMVATFNREQGTNFEMTFRGQYAYLSKRESREVNHFLEAIAKRMGVSMDKFTQQANTKMETKLGRLKYNGQMDNWSFAVFKYSRENYDPNEFMFPGAEDLDGTIDGALMAGMQLY